MNKKLNSVLIISLVIVSILALQGIQTPEETVEGDVLPTPGFNIRIFAWVEGIPGESLYSAVQDWIDILSFEYSIQQAEITPGPTRRRGDVVFGDVLLTKMLDKSTPKLMEAVDKGKVIPTVIIEMTIGPELDIFYRYELKNVLVNSVESSVGTIDGTYPYDSVALTYEEIKVTYTEYDDQGQPHGNTEWVSSVTYIFHYELRLTSHVNKSGVVSARNS
jgi:type VI secretion system Hcp family effector